MADAAVAAWPPGMVVLVPVYNHARTVGAVVASAQAMGARVLCIDDGSTDGSGAAAAAAGAEVRRLEPNQGKGAALAAGLRWAADEGAVQALTVDADGQHPPAAVAALAAAAAREPGALHIGSRDMAGAPASSRFGRWWTNLWIRLAGGIRGHDGQSGLRAYPLPVSNLLGIRAGRYAFEVEAVVRCGWAGIPVRGLPVPVLYPADRVSHFHKLRDNLRTAWTFTRLMTRRCLPWPHRRLGPRPPGWRSLLMQGLSPGEVAAAGALGGAIGVAPLPGIQMGVAAWLAWRLRLNVPLTLLASNISFGPLLFGFFALEIAIGHWLRTGVDPAAHLAAVHAALVATADGAGWWTAIADLARASLLDWLIGAVPVMAAVAAVLAGVGWSAARLLRRTERGG